MKPPPATVVLLSTVLFLSCPAARAQTDSPQQSAPAQASPIAELQRRAEAGDPKAQFRLAILYERGDGVPRNDAEAVRWLRKAAEAGYADAQVNLGLIYRQGTRGITKNPEEAVQWFRKAAEQGNAYGQCELAFMYENGDGVAQDDAEAVRWYTRAADQGLPVAKFDLAFMYENGRGVPADVTKAIALYEEAALSIPTARNNLAVLYSEDETVPKNNVLAYKWALLTISAEFKRILDEGKASGSKPVPFDPEPRLGRAVILAERIAKGMSKSDKLKGRTLAQQWIDSNATRLGDEPTLFPMAIHGLK